jgi:putative tail protein/concanavalin A-like lectin/glucanase superfamily protein
MATLVLGAVGAGIGSAFGNPALGFSLGVALAGVLFAPKAQTQERGRLDDLRVTGSAYGSFIPQIYGRGRIGGNIVWATNLLEKKTKKKVGGKGSSGQKQNIYTYSVNMAVMLCRGPVSSIRRIWGEDKLIYDAVNSPGVPLPANVHLYYGTEDQLPSSVIEAVLGVGNVPAYRGYVYIVFETFDLTPWGGRIPSINVELDQGADYTQFALTQTSLQAYWKFEDDPGLLIDSGPNGWDLTGSASQVAGEVGEALDFTTSGNFLTSAIGDVPALQGTEITLEFRLKYKGSGSDTFSIAYENNTPNAQSVKATIETTGGGRITYPLVITAGTQTVTYDNVDIMDGGWHHVAVTYKAGVTNFQRVWFDGVEVASAAAFAGTLAFTGSGKRIRFDDGSFYVDEVAIFSRELTAVEIANRAAILTGTTVGTILADLFQQVGITSSQYDLALADDEVDGFIIAQRRSVRESIDPLLRVYQVDLIEVDGVIKAVKRGSAAVATLTDDDLGAHEFSSPAPENKLEVKRVPDIELPNAVDLTYLTEAKDYEQASQRAIRPDKPYVDDQVTVSTPLVLEETFARQQVERILYTTWLEREQFGFNLIPAWMWLAPGDCVNVPTAGGSARVRLIGLDTTLFNSLPTQGVLDDAGVLTQTVQGGVAVDTDTEAGTSTDTTLRIWSNNALRDIDADSIGVYVAVAGATDGGDWPGAILMVSRDSGASYQSIEELTDASTIGVANTILAASPTEVGTGEIDTTNTVDILITHETSLPPTSASLAEVLNGANVAYLGDECIQFVTVTPLGSNVYRLSNLLRGRRGTDAYWGTHTGAGTERFILLDNGGGSVRVELLPGDVGVTLQFKAVTFGQEIAAVSPTSLLITGFEFKPYAGVDLRGTRHVPATNDWTVDWVERTRSGGEWIDFFDITQADLPLEFEAEIWDSTFTTLKRTFTALTSATFVYTEAQQITDFGSAQSTIYVRVFQIGTYGRGYTLQGVLS